MANEGLPPVRLPLGLPVRHPRLARSAGYGGVRPGDGWSACAHCASPTGPPHRLAGAAEQQLKQAGVVCGQDRTLEEAATPAPSRARIRPDCRSAGSPPADHAGLLSAARGQVDGREPSFEHPQDHAGAASGHEEAGQRLRTQFRAPTGEVAVAKNASSRSWRSPPRPTTTAGSSRCWRTWASGDHPRRSMVAVLPPHGSRAAMLPFGSWLRGAAAPSP
jgi:hypothetical protein